MGMTKNSLKERQPASSGEAQIGVNLLVLWANQH